MENNKSIDGLVGRSKKTTITKKQTIKKSSTPKTKKPIKKTIKINDFVSETTINPLTKTQTTPEIEPTINEAFLEPVRALELDDIKKSKKQKKKSEKPQKTKKEKKKPGKIRKTISIIALLLVLILIGGTTWLILWGNDIIAKITGGQGNVFDLLTFTNETYEPLKTDENGRTNILAFGTSGYDMDGKIGDSTHDGAALTDSIMVISLDQETGDVAMISLPRDLKVSPICTATGKINEVYWCNNMNGDNEQAGAEALMTEVGSILGLNIEYYAHINWGSLIQIVDTLGGINVTLDEDIYYDYGLAFEAGKEYYLTGEESLWLARARYGTAHGDFSRGASQQKILIGIKDKLTEKNLSITDYLSLASTLGDNLRSNFSIENIKTIAHLLSKFDLNEIRQIPLIDDENNIYYFTTGMINGISYVLPSAGVGNYGKIQKYIAKMLSNDPRVYEDATILILNGTKENGIASSEKYTLEQEGYQNIDTDNAPDGSYEEEYIIYTTTEKPGTKSLLEQRYNTLVKPSTEIPENIPSNYDFIIILGKKE